MKVRLLGVSFFRGGLLVVFGEVTLTLRKDVLVVS